MSSILQERGVVGAAADTALLLTSELVTNALLHAGGSITVNVAAVPSFVRVEVLDHTRNPPVPRSAGADDTGGRGLDLVEHLARRWGVTPIEGDGKTVWFEVATGPGAAR